MDSVDTVTRSKMTSERLHNNNKIQDSTFAKAANRWSWIPLFGLILFFVFLPLALLQLGKGRFGFYLVRRALIKVVFLSALPLVVLIFWAGLPEMYYPDILFGKHGQYSRFIKNKQEDQHYFFGNLFKKTTYYDNSNIKEIENLKDGKRHGLYTLYHKNRQKKLQIQYKMDSFDGYYAAWYDNGQKEFEGKYKDDRYSGTWNGWYEDGQQSWGAQYNEEGNQIGKYTVWHEDGKVALEGQFENGVEVGKWTCYKENGSIDWQTDDYKRKRPNRSLNSKYNIIFYDYSDPRNKNFTKIGTTPSESKIEIYENTYLYAEPFECFTEKDFILIIEELRRKNIVNISCKKIRKKITNQWIFHIKGIPIKDLNMALCRDIDDYGLSYPKGLFLRDVDLWECDKITDTGLSYLINMPLQRLNLWDCINITDKGVSYLNDMPLIELYLINTNITNDSLLYFQNMPLKDLHLENTKITDKGVSYLKNLNLEVLNLSICSDITDVGLSYLKNMLLVRLYLDNTKITDKGLSYLQKMPFEYFSLENCTNISPKYRQWYDNPKKIQLILEEISKSVNDTHKQEEKTK